MLVGEQVKVDQARSGPRPLDPSRDLGQVADLIEAAFGDDMDEEGRRVLQEMRAISYIGLVLGAVVSFTGGELWEAFGGYVWEEGGRVVGNVSLNPLTPAEDRWQISNVAVDAPYRRRGIARRLMALALAEARRQGGTWALLQVRHDNEAALALYRSLGFEALGGETFMAWEGTLPIPLPALGGQEGESELVVRPIQPREWPAEWDLARAAVPPLMQWERPLRPHQFRRSPLPGWWVSLSRWLSGRETHTLGAFQGRALLARLHLRVDRPAGQANLGVLVAPEARGQVERPLLREGLALLPKGGRLRVEAQFPMEQAAVRDALEGLGFQHLRTLVHMRLDLTRRPPTWEEG